MKYTLIGYPLGHSMSREIHETLFEACGTDAEYELRSIPPERLVSELPGILSSCRGINITIPHKQSVIPFLDALKGQASVYGAVNTVSVTEKGRFGYNTDGEGFLYTLRRAEINLFGHVVILGAGGAGRVCAAEALRAGCNVTVTGGSRAQSLCHDMRGIFSQSGKIGAVRDATELRGRRIDLLVNATPVGMTPHTGEMPVAEDVLENTAAVFDAVYNPNPTLLLSRAGQMGARIAGGLPMLVMQAAAAHRIWMDIEYSDSVIESVILKIAERLEQSGHAR